MNRRYVVAIAVLGIAACTTSGPESPVPGAKAEGVIEQVGASEAPVETTIADGDELICTKERLTGSRIPTKVCLTRAERDRIRKVSQDNFEADRRKPGSNPSE
jgi:hypothetical protein